jgi:hypothetical protein
MICRYIEVDIDDALPGMVLHGDVLDPRGSVLLPKGTELTVAHLTSLGRRGIDRVRVLAPAVDEAQLAAERTRVEERQARLFRHAGPGGADAALRAALRSYRMERLQ